MDIVNATMAFHYCEHCMVSYMSTAVTAAAAAAAAGTSLYPAQQKVVTFVKTFFFHCIMSCRRFVMMRKLNCWNVYHINNFGINQMKKEMDSEEDAYIVIDFSLNILTEGNR